MITPTKTALAAAVTVAMLLAGCGEKQSTDHLDNARKYIAKHEITAAIIQLKAILQETNSGEARYLLGTALLEQGNPAAAITELQKAQELKFDPDQVTARLAHAMVLAGKSKEVVETFAGKELQNPGNGAELQTALAIGYTWLKQPDQADAALNKALALDPKYPWALLTRARMLLGKRAKVDEVLAAAEQARTPDGPNGEVDLFQGMLLAAAGRPPEQVQKALSAAAQDPSQALRARTLLAEHFLRHNNSEAAKEQLVLLQKLHPNNPQTAYLDAVLAFQQKDYNRTAAMVEQLMRLSSDNTKLLMLGGSADLMRGALLGAETKLGRVVQTTENAPTARRLLADTYLRMGQPDKALNSLKPLLEQQPPDVGALGLAARAYLATGNLDRAEKLLEVVAAKKPDDMKTQTALALIDLDRGRSAEAFEALRTISQRDAGDSADLAAFSSRLRRKEYDAALAALATLDKKRPDLPTTSYLRGLALTGKRDIPAARASFETALKLAPNYQAALIGLTQLDMAENNLEAARVRLTSWIQQRPQDVVARLTLLDVRQRQNAPAAELLAAIDETVRLAPTEPGPHLAKIIQTKRFKGSREAALVAQTALAALPNDPLVLDAAGVVFAADGQDQQAISAFNRMAKQAPGSPVPALRLAELYDKRGNAAAATSSLERAYEIAPLAPDLPSYLLKHAAQFKDFKQPLSVAKRMQQRYPNRPEGYELEGDAQAAQQHWDAAAAAFKLALARDTGTRLAIKTYDSMLTGSTGRAGAEALARDYLTKQPADSSFNVFLGDRARFVKDYASAERYYRKALELQPTHGIVMNNLGWVLGQMGRRAEGIAVLQKALEIYPKATSMMDTLAELVAADGHVDTAIEWQRRAVELKPDDGSLKLSLARLLLDAGHKQEARDLLMALAQSKAAVPAQAEVQCLLQRAS